jgi:thymidylate kinase
VKYELALLGIDGSGKSTMAKYISDYLIEEGFEPIIVPFHNWVFADKLRNVFGKILDRGRVDRKSPYIPPKNSLGTFIKPPVAFLDNVLFYLLNKPRRKNQVVIFDRFICATQIKFLACNYRTNWFKPLWWRFKPKNAIIFLIDEDESIKRQSGRNDDYVWEKSQLIKEKDLYKKFAYQYGFPIIVTKGKSPEQTFKEVKIIINKIIGKG